MGKVIGLTHKRVHECKWEFDGHFLHDESLLPTNTVWFKVDVRLSSIDDSIVATWEALGDEELLPSTAGVIGSLPPPAGKEEVY